MNLLLIHPRELDETRVTLTDRRAVHCRKVLGVQKGDTLRAGIENVGTCDAEVEGVESDAVTLRLGEVTKRPSPTLHVALAVPRPKGLSRILSSIASFGVSRVTLFNAWRVEKSYFASARLDPKRIREDLLLGAEQGRQSWVPSFQVADTFREFLSDVTSEEHPTNTKILFDPSGETDLRSTTSEASELAEESTLLVFGPDGGFIAPELQSFDAAGFVRTSLRTGPLRTEVAVAAALGQWALLRGKT